jgi:hypothetical protein
MITEQTLKAAMSYLQYKTLLEDLLRQGKTTGPNQSHEYLDYAKINLQRMNRLEKTVVLIDDLKFVLSKIKTPYTWLVLTEGWCGDAAQSLPILYHIEKECSFIHLKLILRDEHPGIMDLYLTNGSKSIPKLICLSGDLSEKSAYKEHFSWGPRPAGLQEIVVKLKKENAPKEKKGLLTQTWYNADKTLSAQKELLNLVRKL